MSDETIAAISAARIKSLLAPRNAWHLARCSACRKEVVELRFLVSNVGQIKSSEPESDVPFDFFSLVVRYWQGFVAGGAVSATAVLLLGAFLLFHVSGSSNSPSTIVTSSSNGVLPTPNQVEGTGITPILLASRGATNDSKRCVGIIVGCNDAAAEAKAAAEKLDAAYSVIRLLTPGSFPETRPTLANIIRELGQLPKSAEGGHLVVFWAGQGLCVNGQAYLLPQDATGDVKTTGLTLEQLSKAVAESKLNLLSRSLVVELGRDTSSSRSQDFLRCLLAHSGEWQIVTNAQSWLQSVENTNPEK